MQFLEVIRDALLAYLKEHPEVLTSVLNSHTLTQHLATKEDLKLLISLINKRFEDMNKRFEDMNKRFEDMNQKFSLIVKLMLSFDIPLLILVISLVIKSFFM